MTDEITSDGKTSTDEKSSGLAKLESMSKEELIKLIKSQMILRKKYETKINELTNSNQIEEELRHEIDQNKINQSKLQDEISNLQNELSIVRSSLITESQKSSSSSHSELLSNSISIVIDLFQLPISLPDSIDHQFLKIYKNELEQKQENYKQIFEQIEQEKSHLQQRIEDFEFFNEEVKLENDDLRLKSKTYQHDKHMMEKEIDNYRRQIEDFEEQFLELQRESYHHQSETFEKSQQQPSINSSLLTLDENVDEISFQCINSILNEIDDQNQQISKASSTSSLLLSSDIPTLLHSVGITNCTDEEFSIPLNFESVLHLCTLLIERCRVLQYILLKNNDISLNSLIDNHYDQNSILFSQNNHYEQCQILIHKQDHIVLDTIFERIYTGMNQIISSNDWQILIQKSIDQSVSPSIRLEFDNFKFVPEEIEQNLIRLRSQYDQLLKENEKQRNEISVLEKRLHSNNSYEQLKEHQTLLEEQLVQQCEKTIQLENILQQANIDKTKFDQLKQIEYSYNELEKKYHIAEQLEEQLKELNQNFNEKILEFKQQNDLFEKLKIDYEHQHFYLIERDEHIRLLKLEIEEHDKLKEDLIDKYQNQIKTIQKEFEQQKDLLLNTTQNDDQRYLLISKQQNELNDLFQRKIDENKSLFEKNLQLEKNVQDMNQILLEKDQQIDQLNKQFEFLNIEYEEFQIHFNQIKEEKTKLINEINSLMDKPEFVIDDQMLRQENEKLHQTIKELNEKIDSENVQELKEKYQKMKMLLTRLKKELQEKNYQPKQSSIDLELADYEKTMQNFKDEILNKDKDLQDLRDELANSTENYACLKLEVQNLEQQKLQAEERANKFKALLDIAKKDLQNVKDLQIQRHQNDGDIRGLIETLQIQLDKNKILIQELMNEKQQLTEKINNQNETNQKTISLLEQNLRIAKHDLDIGKQDYDTLQDDFNSYKIRAQSVLKQHQSTQRERTPSLVDKHVELEETIEKYKTTLQEANNKMQLLISEYEVLQKERDHLVEIQAKLINESKKREQDLRKQHQIEIEKFKNEYLQRINDSHDMLKNMTLQNETISIAFKEQIATMESDHERSISILQKQLQTSEQEIEQLQNRIELIKQEKLTSNSDSSQIGIMNDSNKENTLAWSTYERQQGEGPESPNAVVKTLENVQLNGSNTIQNTTARNNNSIPSTPSDKPAQVSFDNIESERQRMEEELNKTKLQLLNTAELLSESELNNQRLNEQVTLLKDEIRRIERNMDRAESISNLEYLKNIILKFFILKSTPERLQLIPVLVTMLKLSPEEQAQLVRVANIPTILDENFRNDESPSQQITNGAASPSWGSYLNIW